MPLPNIVSINNSTNDSTSSASSSLDTSPNNLHTSPIFDFDAHPDTLRRSSRSKKSPTYLHDFECNFAHARHHESDILYPLSHVLTYSKLSSSFYHFISSISVVREPTSFKQVVTDNNWTHAMQSELTTLDQNNTWTLTELLQGKKPIGCRRVYKVKYNVDGSIERYKAHLVAKGFNQIEGVDYFDTYSHVAKLTTKTSKFSKDLGQPLTGSASYRRLIGKVIYLTNTRPDISYAIQQLSQFMSSPTNFHYDTTIQIPRYLKLSPAQGIMLSSSSSVNLKLYVTVIGPTALILGAP
ncbi:uncharacterized protein [Cicer arietinum]|uniref:uncharacterized protein isoform X1 n=1 Tax=Cicer arietinum TaxID=3827 RepID=UPI003CC5F52A